MTKQPEYFYQVSNARIKDGDTVDMYFDLGFKVRLTVTVRLLGVDAPETWRPTSEKERTAGKLVTEFLTQLLTSKEGKLFCHSVSMDLYGRSLGTLYYLDEHDQLIDINQMLLDYMTTNNITKAEARTP